MIIRLYKINGIKTINIVRKDSYIDELKKEGGDYVLNQEANDFDEKLNEIANKESATLAFDSIGGEMLGRILYAMPHDSEMRLLGAFSTQPLQATLQDILFYGKEIKGVWITKFLESLDKDELTKFLSDLKPLLKDVLKTHIAKEFKLDDYLDALKAYKELSGTGKIVLNPW